MSRRQRGSDSDEEDSISGSDVAMGVGIGVAALAGLIGAAYGAKKLYDHYQEEKEKQELSVYRNPSPPSYAEQRPSAYSLENQFKKALKLEDKIDFQDSFGYASHETAQAKMSLQASLQEYHDTYAKVENYRMERAKQVVADIKDAIVRYFREKYPGTISDLEDTGSVAEGLKVINPDEFDVIIRLCWSFEGFSPVPTVPGFYALQLPKGIRPGDRIVEGFMKNGYLSPSLLRSFFQSRIQMAINQISQYNIKSGNKGPSILLQATYDNNCTTSIDFVPVLEVGNIQLVAKPHPKFLKGERDFEMYWRRSFSMKEKRILADPRYSHHKECLRIMKAVRLNHNAQLGMMSSYLYKTILLHMIGEDEDQCSLWNQECLEDLFVRFIKRFKEFSESKPPNLPHYFIPEINLFEQFGSTAIGNVYYYLSRVIRKGSYKELLNERNVQKR